MCPVLWYCTIKWLFVHSNKSRTTITALLRDHKTDNFPLTQSHMGWIGEREPCFTPPGYLSSHCSPVIHHTASCVTLATGITMTTAPGSPELQPTVTTSLPNKSDTGGQMWQLALLFLSLSPSRSPPFHLSIPPSSLSLSLPPLRDGRQHFQRLAEAASETADWPS